MGKLSIKDKKSGNKLSIETNNLEISKTITPEDFKYIRNIVSDMQDLRNKLSHGDVLFIKGYHEVNDGGGGIFIYDENISKLEHDGGIIIDPDKDFPIDWTNEELLDNWFTSNNTGNGCWVRINEGPVSVDYYGARGDGNIDDSKSVDMAINRNKSIIFDSKKTYKISKNISTNKSNLVIDFNNSKIVSDNEDVIVFSFMGGLEEVFTTTSDINIGSINIDGFNGDENDVYIIIASNDDDLWTNTRDSYIKGEIIEFKNNNILKEPIKDTYKKGAVLYKINSKNLIIKNINSVRNGKYFMKVENYSDVKIENVDIKNSTSYGIMFHHIHNGYINNCRINNYTLTDYGYGIVISSSSNILINNANIIAKRHGLTTGGQFPCRFITITNSIFNSNNFTGALNFHENIEYATISNTKANGFDLSGRYITVNNCYAYGTEDRIPFSYIPGKEGSHQITVDNLVLELNNNITVGFRVVSPYPMKTVDQIYDLGTISLNNIKVITDKTRVSNIFYLGHNDKTRGTMLYFRDININNLSINLDIDTNDEIRNNALVINNISSNGIARLNNSYIKAPVPISIYNKDTLNDQNIIIDNTSLIGDNNRFNNVIVKLSNVSAKSVYGRFFTYNTEYNKFIINNLEVNGFDYIVYNVDENKLLECSLTNVISELPYYKIVRNWSNIANKIYYKEGLNRIFYNNDVFEEGNFKSGDVIKKINNSDRTNIGWICIYSGNPGTWEEYGVIRYGRNLKLTNLPTSDPKIKDALWNDNGVLKISQG